MSAFAMAIKNATYNEMSSLVDSLIDKWALDRPIDNSGRPIVEKEDLAASILYWADETLNPEGNK
ncbi:MAG: hypothetical protein WA790_05105 [Sulfitobacter sp.]